MRPFRGIREVPPARERSGDDPTLVKMFGVLSLGFLVGVLLLLSVVFGSSRRRSKSTVLKAVLWASYTLMTQLIAYTLSVTRHTDSTLVFDKALWPMLIMVAFGGADSFSAYSLLDCEQWKRYNWQLLLKLGTILVILYEGSVQKPYFILFAIIFSIFLWAALPKVFMKTQSLAASSSLALGKNGKLLADYMRTEHEETESEEVDPATLKGYKYLVSGEEMKNSRTRNRKIDVTSEQVVTLEKVWGCDGKLLSSDSGDRLKDSCMSFSFFKLLCLRYAGYKLPPQAHEKTWRLIRYRLLLSEGSGYERLFRVVEEELAFLFDLFYTKRFFIFQHRRRLWIKLFEFFVIGAMSSFLISMLCILGYWILTPWGVTVTMYFVAESVQCLSLLFTTLAEVTCTCKYVTHRSWRAKKVAETCVRLICCLHFPKPWERKLHQCSILESYTYRPCKLFSNRFASMFINWQRDGQKEQDPINLSVDVKNAVFDCLKISNGSTLENGDASLRRHGVSHELLWACRLDTEVEVIMVWHIATTMCESRARMSEPFEKGKNIQAAAIGLSNYLGYLVAFSPRLLPDHPYITELCFDSIVREARIHLKGCKTVQKRVDKLITYQPETEQDTTLAMGARLGRQLLDNLREPAVIWKVLVDFWAETMLYVAPSEDTKAHAEQLANGGEFVTHLWALLHHVGIRRMKYPRPSHRRVVKKPPSARDRQRST